MSRIVSIAIVLVMFYDALVMLLLPSTVNIFCPPDGSMASFASFMCAIVIGMFAIYKYGICKLNNKWLLAVPVIMIFSHFHSQNIKFESSFVPKDMAIFNYRPMFMVLMFMFMGLGIYSSEINFNKIYKVLGVIAIIYSVYIVFQRMHIDQFYFPAGQPLDQESRHPEAGAFISQPVFAAAVLAILLPFVRRFGIWQAVFCLIAIFLTGNRSASFIGSMCFLFSFKKTSRLALICIWLYIFSLVVAWAAWYLGYPILYEERFLVWTSAVLDVVIPKFPGMSHWHILTGDGIGSFSIIFPFYHHSGYYQAHNEYLEIFKGMGAIGIFVFLKAVVKMFKDMSCDLPIIDALIAASALAFTNAVWHNPQLGFLTTLLIGLALNQTRSRNALATTAR